MIEVLPRVVASGPGKPHRPEAEASQARARAVAEDASRWSATVAHETVMQYRELAPDWDEHRGWYRPVPLRDALVRGGPFCDGVCAEVGGGTGLLTPMITSLWSRTVSIDLSPDMLGRSTAAWRVRADGVRLPLSDDLAAAVVLADAPLFASEVVRVLRRDGAVVWSNALGRDAPQHVPIATVLASLQRVDPAGAWTAVTSEAGWGLWAVFRRTFSLTTAATW